LTAAGAAEGGPASAISGAQSVAVSDAAATVFDAIFSEVFLALFFVGARLLLVFLAFGIVATAPSTAEATSAVGVL